MALNPLSARVRLRDVQMKGSGTGATGWVAK